MRKSEVENLIYVALRFKSEEYGIVVDSEGWTKIDNFIYRINFLHGTNIIDRIALYSIVKHNPKFTMNVFKTKLKANKLKSEEAPITLKKTLPPDQVYGFISYEFEFHSKQIIKPEPGNKFVVLATKRPENVDGKRIIIVDSRQMLAAGYTFYLSHDGDILTEKVPCKFVKIMNGV